MPTGLQKLQSHVHALTLKREKIHRALVAEQKELYPDETTVEALERNMAAITKQIDSIQAQLDRILNGN